MRQNNFSSLEMPDYQSVNIRRTDFSKLMLLEEKEKNLEKAISLTEKIQEFAYNTQAENYASEEYLAEFENLVKNLLNEANFSEHNQAIIEEMIDVYRHNLIVSQEIMKPVETTVTNTKNKFAQIFDIFYRS